MAEARYEKKLNNCSNTENNTSGSVDLKGVELTSDALRHLASFMPVCF